jgi:endoglucanase
MRPAWRTLALALAPAAFVAAFAATPAIADTALPSFKRGATLVEFFEFPATTGDGIGKAYAVPAFPHPLAALNLFDFDALHRNGFDHMRVPLDVGPLMRGSDQQRREILAQLTAVIAQINRHGLAVLVTLFPPSLHHELPETYLDGLDGPKFRAYAAEVERVATALAAMPSAQAASAQVPSAQAPSAQVALEPMNEPQSKCRVVFGTDWSAYQQVLIGRIRHISAQLPLFLTGGCWSNIEGLADLDTDLLHDPRNFVSIHFYYPFLFTHQGATWSEPYLAGTIGVPYPASAGNAGNTLELTLRRMQTMPPAADPGSAQAKAEAEIEKYFAERQGPQQIEEWMDRVAQWQKREQVPSSRIVFTEFGAMKETVDGAPFDRASRARWLHDTAASIARRGWGWTVYVLRDDPFGLYRQESDRNPDPELLQALGLGTSSAAE